MEVPDPVVKILKELRDVMFVELPKELPPQRPIDHKIELLLGTSWCRFPLKGQGGFDPTSWWTNGVRRKAALHREGLEGKGWW